MSRTLKDRIKKHHIARAVKLEARSKKKSAKLKNITNPRVLKLKSADKWHHN